MKFLDKKRLMKVLIDINNVIEINWVIGAVCYMLLIFSLLNENATLDAYIMISIIYVVLYFGLVMITSLISQFYFGLVMITSLISLSISQFNPIPFIFSLTKSIGVFIFSLGIAIIILYLKESEPFD